MEKVNLEAPEVYVTGEQATDEGDRDAAVEELLEQAAASGSSLHGWSAPNTPEVVAQPPIAAEEEPREALLLIDEHAHAAPVVAEAISSFEQDEISTAPEQPTTVETASEQAVSLPDGGICFSSR